MIRCCCALAIVLLSTAREQHDKSLETSSHLPAARIQVSDPARVDSLDRGLLWLAARQREQLDGSMPGTNAPTAVTALAALAFMAAGSSPERGPYGTQVSASIDYLLDRADLSPESAEHGYIQSEGDRLSRMHGHGLATLALAQAYSMSPRTPRGRRMESALIAAVALIERTQGHEGGWQYEPRRLLEHEGSVTICLVQALRGAQNAGIRVDSNVIHDAVDYVRRLQNEDGTFRYALDVDRTTVALTAASMATLNATGEYESDVLSRGMDALWRALTARAVDPDRDRAPEVQHPFYERFYLAQALWQHQDRRLFTEWSAPESARVLARQKSDGSWSGSNYGDTYATAMNCLFLAMPLEFLPIFQR
jgi:hypothetical protein